VTLRIDPRDRFSATVDLYRKYRPSYPPQLIDWLTAGLAPSARIADLGCGTGIATRLLAARGFPVVGIDPNEDMLAEARKDGGGASYRRGEAAATGLDEASIELCTAGQAFHWFELPPTMRELARILAPAGRAAAFWNLRARSSAMDDYDALLRRYSSEYERLRSPFETVAEIRAFPGVRDVTEIDLTDGQSFDREAFRGRVYSSSYVAHGVDRKDELDRELDALFDRHAVDGRLEFPYRVFAIGWRLA
jgi:SAM-dependent methyltransferase